MQPQMSIVINRSFFLFVLISIFSCSESKNECSEENQYLIVKSIIENMISYPSIPPPPPENMDINEFLNDSIKLKEWVEIHNIKKSDIYKIAIQPFFWNPTNSIKLDSSYTEDYQLLVDQLITHNNESPIMLEKINSSEKFVLKSAPSNDSLKVNPGLWENFDFILSFSRISFNDNCNKAVLIYSKSYGSLNGYSVLILMRKVKDSWVEIHSLPLTIS